MQQKSGKQRIMAAVILAAVLAVVFVGCANSAQSSLFTATIKKDNSVLVEAANAQPDSSAYADSLIVRENQQVVIEANFDEGGVLRVILTGDSGKPEATVSGSDTVKFTAIPGEYMVQVTAESILNGTAKILVEATGSK